MSKEKKPQSDAGHSVGKKKKKKENDVIQLRAGNVQSNALQTLAAGLHKWSEEELLNAEPVPQPVCGESGHTETQLLEAADGFGGQFDAGGLPKNEATTTQNELLAAGSGYEYPAPFTRADVFLSNYELYPYSCVGKIFFRQGASSYVGSAFSVGNNAVFTAGHCVHPGDGDQDGWFTNFVFIPGYKVENGQVIAPFGQWPASRLLARQQWVNQGGLSEDLGGAVLHKSNGQTISEVVGHLGFAWNFPREQHWNAVGYPAQAPFDGQKMVATQASYAYDGSVNGIKPVAIGCDMTQGCSGGPWIRGFGTKNQANGLNSYRRSDFPLEMLSPYFDDRAKALKDDLVAASP